MSEEQRKEWEYFQDKAIPAYIDRLQDLEEQKSDIDVKKKDIIQEIAERAEQFMPSDEVSRFLKLKLKGVVADRTIEEALGQKHKRKYESLPRDSKARSADIDHNKTIEVSTSGSQSVTGPDGNEKEEEAEIGAQDIYTNPVVAANRIPEDEESDIHDVIAERSAEIALNTIDILKKELQEKDTRINEAFALIKDRQKRIQELQMQMGEIEIELGNLKKNPPAAAKNVDEKEELQIKYDELKVAYEELKQVETLRTKQQDFKPASIVASAPKVWVAAINAINFYRELNKASKYAIEHNEPWKKLLFDVASDGQLKVARLEGT